MMNAPPPSEITQQSSLCSGSAIMRELRTSSTVIGSRYCANGLRPANSRTPTAISASCSGVVPNSCMCRRAAMAYPPANTLPQQLSYCAGPWTRVEPVENVLVPSRRPIRESMSEP
jgi:hypothetical protein